MPSTSNRIRRALEQEIVTNALGPGQRLDEPGLAKRFGSSRTPVREALVQLSSMGLVEIRPHRGAVVAKLGLAELIEMFEVMAELEATCGRLAAQRITEAELAALEAIHGRCRQHAETGDVDAYYDASAQFHEAVYAASHNRFLRRQTLQLGNRLAPYRRLQLRRPNRTRESFLEHERIVAAISRGAGDAAASLLREHVTKQGGSFNDFVACLPSELPQPCER